jgi:hypothetical protein
LTEVIWRQHSIQGVAWLLLSAVCHICSKNEKKETTEGFEKFAVWPIK